MGFSSTETQPASLNTTTFNAFGYSIDLLIIRYYCLFKRRAHIMETHTPKLILRSLTYTGAMLVVYGLLNTVLTGDVWHGMVISKSALTAEYCEFDNIDKFFRQLMNTYSNLVYFFFGIMVCLVAQTDGRNEYQLNLNRLQQFPLLSWLMGVCLIYLSFGSAFFHASLTWIGQRVDMNGTYGISLVLLCIALYNVFYKVTFSGQAKKIAVFFLVVFILVFYKIALLVSSSILLPAFILTTWLLIIVNYVQFRKERSILLAISSIVLIIVALKIRTMDVQKIGCDPHSLYQGHSVWHLLAGLSSFCSYAFFRFTPSHNRAIA